MKFDPFDITAIQAMEAEGHHEAALRAKQTAENWMWITSSKRGRAILSEILTRCGVYSSSFTGNSETFFREGQRNVGLYVLKQIQENAPEHYLEMVKETQNA